MAVNIQSSGVTRGSGEGGRTAPGDTRLKLFLAEFSVYFLNSATKIILVSGVTPWRVSVGVVRRRQLRFLQRRWLKKVISFSEENIGWHHQVPPRVTPPIQSICTWLHSQSGVYKMPALSIISFNAKLFHSNVWLHLLYIEVETSNVSSIILVA